MVITTPVHLYSFWTSLKLCSDRVKVKILLAATKLGQGNIFTSVCQEFCPWGEGVCLSACWDTHTPPDQADPPRVSRHPLPREQTPLPPEQTDPPNPRTRQIPPPGKQTPAYGLRAAGTYPTGMHSCLWCLPFILWFFACYLTFFRFLTLFCLVWIGPNIPDLFTSEEKNGERSNVKCARNSSWFVEGAD